MSGTAGPAATGSGGAETFPGCGRGRRALCIRQQEQTTAGSRAQRDPRGPSRPPRAAEAAAHLLDGRHGVPALGRARGEAGGRGRLVVLMGLGHEFRHGDLVRHRRGARARTTAASVAQGAGSDPAAAAAPGGGQRGARGAGAAAGRGSHRGTRGGSRGVRSPQLCPLCSGSRRRRRRRVLSERAQTRARTAGGNCPPPSRGPRRLPRRGAGPGQGAVAGGARGGAGRRPGHQSARSPPPRRREAQASGRREVRARGPPVAAVRRIVSVFGACRGSRARPTPGLQCPDLCTPVRNPGAHSLVGVD